MVPSTSMSLFAVMAASLLSVCCSIRTEEVDHTLHANTMLQVENARLHEEVNELRQELRLAASGAFIREKRSENKTGQSGHSVSVADRVSATQQHQLLSEDLLTISDQIAKDAASGAFKLSVPHPSNASSNKSDIQDRQVLIVMYSNGKNYASRVRWALETWAKSIPSSHFLIIGDSDTAKLLEGTSIHTSRCKPQNRGMTMCCRYAEAVIITQAIMSQRPDLKWAYMVDDDSFVRADALERTIQKQSPSRPKDRGVALGNYGCETRNCGDILCGGSGYALDRWAVDLMTANDPAGLVQEMMRGCNRCGGDSVGNKGIWAEAGLSQVLNSRGIEQRKLDGAYGWLLDKSCMQHSLDDEKEPVMYHMIRTQQQFDFLQRLFAPVQEQTGSSTSAGSNAALDGIGGCVEFHGNVQCASTRLDEDHPWHHSTSLCGGPQMPRTHVILGLCALLLLLLIVVTLIWTGIKYREWDGWKLHASKEHGFAVQRFK